MKKAFFGILIACVASAGLAKAGYISQSNNFQFQIYPIKVGNPIYQIKVSPDPSYVKCNSNTILIGNHNVGNFICNWEGDDSNTNKMQVGIPTLITDLNSHKSFPCNYVGYTYYPNGDGLTTEVYFNISEDGNGNIICAVVNSL